jgi:hypothetical protein
MTLIQENGRADWVNNKDHLRILYSIAKVHMEKNMLEFIPAQKSDKHTFIIAEKFSLAIGESVDVGKVSGQLWFQFDATDLANQITDQFMNRLRIALEVGLINTKVFTDMMSRVKSSGTTLSGVLS